MVTVLRSTKDSTPCVPLCDSRGGTRPPRRGGQSVLAWFGDDSFVERVPLGSRWIPLEKQRDTENVQQRDAENAKGDKPPAFRVEIRDAERVPLGKGDTVLSVGGDNGFFTGQKSLREGWSRLLGLGCGPVSTIHRGTPSASRDCHRRVRWCAGVERGSRPHP